jgi:AcrR family transcriptional regulator
MSEQRGYKLKKRALGQEETRRRIVEAVVSLHEEVGPARTTVVDIADRAGVSRPTVYSHFPDEGRLMTACSNHWLADNPLPDPAAWERIADPHERLRVALVELYSYYAPRERMLANVLRDSRLSPVVFEAVERNFGRYWEAVVSALATGWDRRRGGRRKLLAALQLALDFHTWQTLTKRGRLTEKDAVELMATLVESAQ